MNKKYDRDIKFVINTFVCGLLFIALLQAFGPYLGNPDAKRQQVIDTQAQIRAVSPADLPKLLARQDKKPVMLVMYASWCPYCRRLMPGLFDMIKAHELDNVVPVFISVDERRDFLAMYIVHAGYMGLYTPYIAPESLLKPLLQAGSHYQEHIPYVGFFDGEGKSVAEFNGMVDKGLLLETARTLK
jgi:thiol-disulfide isomerase/thioredoxin